MRPAQTAWCGWSGLAAPIGARDSWGSGACSRWFQASLLASLGSADRCKPLQTLTVCDVIMQNDSGLYGADAPPERDLRAPEGRPLAKGGHALVPGEGR